MPGSTQNAKILDDFLVDGLSDYNDLSWAVGSAMRDGVSGNRATRHYAIGLVTELMAEGLIVPGDLRDGEFFPWPGELYDWLKQILDSWGDADADEITPGMLGWFDNTEAGIARARHVLASEQSDAESRGQE